MGAVHVYPPLLTESSLYPQKGQVPVFVHVGDFQVLQDYGAIAVSLHHVQVVVIFGTKKV